MTLKLDDPSSIAAAESAINAKVPPFLKYYESWRKIHNQQQARKVTKNEEVRIKRFIKILFDVHYISLNEFILYFSVGRL